MVTISAGDSLGPYQIDSAIGQGGMAVVYRARDTNLGRDVAIKILPEEETGDIRSRRAHDDFAPKSSVPVFSLESEVLPLFRRQMELDEAFQRRQENRRIDHELATLAVDDRRRVFARLRFGTDGL